MGTLVTMAPLGDMLLLREDGNLKSVSRLSDQKWDVTEDQIDRYCFEWMMPRLDLEYRDEAHLSEITEYLVGTHVQERPDLYPRLQG